MSQPYNDPQSSYGRPALVQLRGHDGVVRDVVFPPAGAGGIPWPDVNMLPPVENVAAHGQPQDPRYVDIMGYCDPPPPHEHRDYAINNHAGVALDVPPQALPAVIDIFDNPARTAAAGPAPACLHWPHEGLVPDVPPDEVVRQLAIQAIRHLRDPNSQISIIRVEPGHARGIRVEMGLTFDAFIY